MVCQSSHKIILVTQLAVKANCWLVLYLTFPKSAENVAVAWIIPQLGAEYIKDPRIFPWDHNKDNKSIYNM